MRKNQYKELTVKDLWEVYTTTKANYGKIEGDLLAEVENRGGEAKLVAAMQRENALNAEKARIQKEVAALMGDHADTTFLKKLVDSDLMSESELNQYIDFVHQRLVNAKFNRSIDTKTIVGSLIGLMVGSMLGAMITTAQIAVFGKFFYPSIIMTYFISWIIIRIITKKNGANLIVLLSSSVAAVLGPLIVLFG